MKLIRRRPGWKKNGEGMSRALYDQYTTAPGRMKHELKELRKELKLEKEQDGEETPESEAGTKEVVITIGGSEVHAVFLQHNINDVEIGKGGYGGRLRAMSAHLDGPSGKGEYAVNTDSVNFQLLLGTAKQLGHVDGYALVVSLFLYLFCLSELYLFDNRCSARRSNFMVMCARRW
jgi:hypothetical protein